MDWKATLYTVSCLFTCLWMLSATFFRNLNYPTYVSTWKVKNIPLSQLHTPMEVFFWWKRCWFPNTGPPQRRYQEKVELDGSDKNVKNVAWHPQIIDIVEKRWRETMSEWEIWWTNVELSSANLFHAGKLRHFCRNKLQRWVCTVFPKECKF